MNIQELIKFKEQLSDININNLKDEEFMEELSNIFLLLGDTFAIVKNNNSSGYPAYSHMRKVKESCAQLRYKKKNENSNL